CSYAAFHGWRSRNVASASAISNRRRRMKSAWIGICFSHHSVPSLSKTATRSSTGTPSERVRSTNSTTARFAAVSRHPLRPSREVGTSSSGGRGRELRQHMAQELPGRGVLDPRDLLRRADRDQL